MGGFLPGPAFAPQPVQSAYTRITDGSIPGTVTLAHNPTVGNWLVAIGTGFDNRGGLGSEVRLPPGFGILNDFVNAAQAINVGLRKVRQGDGRSYVFEGGNGGNTYGILEFPPLTNALAITSIPTIPVTALDTLAFGSAGVAAGAYVIGIVESDQTNALVSVTGGTLLFDGTDVASNHPSVIFQVTAMQDNILIKYTTALAFGTQVGMLVSIFG